MKTVNKSRIVFLNPNTVHVGVIVSSYFNKKKNYKRYRHFLKSKYKTYDIAVLFNSGRSSFRRKKLNKILTNPLAIWFEILPWLFLNLVSPLKYKIYKSVKSLKSTDIIFTFSHDLIMHSTEKISALHEFNGYTLVHMTHYYYNPIKLQSVLTQLRNPILVSEGFLLNNDFYKFFGFNNYPHFQIQNIFESRFINQNLTSNRINKCLALGTLVRINQSEFKVDSKFVNYLHPMREEIYKRQHDFINELVCHVSVSPKFNMKERVDSDFSYDFDQSKYSSFDLVEELHNYMFFVAPEEIIGLPSVNFIDGMIAGCVYVGINHEMYKAIGMRPHEHYIAYEEGNFDDLIEKIRYYQKHLDEAISIAKNGKEFAQKHFSEKSVIQKFNKFINSLD